MNMNLLIKYVTVIFLNANPKLTLHYITLHYVTLWINNEII